MVDIDVGLDARRAPPRSRSGARRRAARAARRTGARPRSPPSMRYCSLLPLVATAASRSTNTRSSRPVTGWNTPTDQPAAPSSGHAEPVDVAADVHEAGAARPARRSASTARSTAQPLPIEPRSSPRRRARAPACRARDPRAPPRQPIALERRGRSRGRRGIARSARPIEAVEPHERQHRGVVDAAACGAAAAHARSTTSSSAASTAHRAAAGGRVHARQLAVGAMDAHLRVDARDRRERALDRARRALAVVVARDDAHPGAERRTAHLDASRPAAGAGGGPGEQRAAAAPRDQDPSPARKRRRRQRLAAGRAVRGRECGVSDVSIGSSIRAEKFSATGWAGQPDWPPRLA